MSGAGKRRGGGQIDSMNNPRENVVSSPAAYDGPASQSGSAAGGNAPHPQDQGGPPRGDPALDRPKLLTDMCRNIDLPAAAYFIDGQYHVASEIIARPGYNTNGKDVNIQLNAYPISQFPTKPVYQYDVLVGNGVEKRIVVEKVWKSNTRKQKVGNQFIFDGNKLAWALVDLKDEVNVLVDLDVEEGRTNTNLRTGNQFRLVVRRTKVVNLGVIQSYLEGKVSFSSDILEGLTFLDHVLRESPSGKFITLRRSFFSEKSPRSDLGGGVEAWKGMYQSIRVAQPGRLVVNIDVSNACFWIQGSILGAALAMFKYRDPQHFTYQCRPVPDHFGGHVESEGFKRLRRLHKIVVRPNYRGCPVAGKDFVIKKFVNAGASDYTLDIKDPATGTITTMNLVKYFLSRYNVRIEYPQLPLVEMTKKGVVYPLELLSMSKPQRYPFKLDEFQTSSMIKFAVSRPQERLKAIMDSKEAFNHLGDPVLKGFGLKVENTMIRTKAKLLPNPEIMFGGGLRFNPGTNGRWDLRGKKFYGGNPKPLESWGVGYFTKGRSQINRKQIEDFVGSFIKQYIQHGGTVANKNPVILDLPDDAAAGVKFLHEQIVKQTPKVFPQLYLLIVQDKNSFHWTRLKKSSDCRFGVASQVVQSAQVAKNSGQYISNVLMKVNAKLGGVTSRVSSKINGDGLRPFSMIIGADVSHPTPGSTQPSMAAMTMSIDGFGGRYMAACQTNSGNVEVIGETNIREMLYELLQEWAMNIGKGRYPENVYYFRDGVSEGQFQHILQRELPIIKKMLLRKDENWKGKFTVVICSKRHHLRAFPKPGDKACGDKNGNPLPGVLIERDVTSPHEWDFLLYSHVALQGTSRPVHYNVILDQIGHNPNQLPNMIYEHCYQYMRSTTSVSLFPAVYYAHLASNRAKSHENVPASSGPRAGNIIKLDAKPDKHANVQHVTERLLPFPDNHFRFKMWFI